MIGAHAQHYGMNQKYNNYEQDYGMDRYDDKQSYEKDSNSYDKSKDSNVNCNNINSNLNRLNDNTLPGSTTAEDIGTQALQKDDASANTFGNGPRNNNDNFAVKCINNNNNENNPVGTN